MDKLKLAILGSTNGTDLIAIVNAIKNKKLNAEIEVIISNKATAGILQKAKKSGILGLYVNQRYNDGTKKKREEFDHEIMKILETKKIDLILLIGYMRILSKPFVKKYHNKIMNVHPSLLPAFAGGMDLNVHEEVLNSGVKVTGCTIHFVDEGVDSGKIITQKWCEVEPHDTVESLKQKVQKLEGGAFVEAVHDYICHRERME